MLLEKTAPTLIARKTLSFPASWAFPVAGHPILQSFASPALLSSPQLFLLVP